MGLAGRRRSHETTRGPPHGVGAVCIHAQSQNEEDERATKERTAEKDNRTEARMEARARAWMGERAGRHLLASHHTGWEKNSPEERRNKRRQRFNFSLPPSLPPSIYSPGKKTLFIFLETEKFFRKKKPNQSRLSTVVAMLR